MTTIISKSRQSCAINQHLVLEHSIPPFPTAPSLPDRQGRLKRINLARASAESVKSDSNIDMHVSQTVSRTRGEPASPYGELVLHKLSAPANEISSDNNHSRDNNSSMDNISRANNNTRNNSNNDNNSSRDDNSSKDNNSSRDNIRNRNDNSSKNNSNRDLSKYSNKAARGHRNIVTSRRRAEEPSWSPLPSHAALTFNTDKNSSRMKVQETENMQFLPTVSSTNPADPPPLPDGVFLTSLALEDYSTRRNPGHTSSFLRQGADTFREAPSGLHNHTRDQLPDVVLSSDNSPSSRSLAHHSTSGLQRVYREGLEYMRTHVLNVEKGADLINRQFHKVLEDDWLSYVSECNQRLLQANVTLLKAGIPLQVIDSETRLVALINSLRSVHPPDKSLVEFLTRFWGELKTSTEELQVLLDKFNCSVLQRFSNNYTSSHIVDLQVPFCHKYALDIEEFLKDLDSQLSNASLLLKNSKNAEHKKVADKSWLAQRLVISCDLKAFPILGFVSDICGMITAMCETARLWLARDEQFMHEVNGFIRETRAVTRKREQILLTEKMKQKRVEKNARVAHCMLRNNREKLRLIEAELQELEQKLNKSKEEQKARLLKIHHKESMVDFLKVTLQQTRKSCRLQTKRSKLLKQVKELGDYLKVMEVDLELVQDQILAKSHQRILLAEKISTSEKSYGALQSDLDRCSDSLEELEAEVSGLSGQLLQLEIVHTIRTCPEILDSLTDRPSSVRLSQSLKERIKERQRKSVTLN